MKSEANFEKILDVFFQEHSATYKTKAQYKSAVWCQNDQQFLAVREKIERMERAGEGPIKTDVYAPSESVGVTWYDAEEYHQRFYAKQTGRSWI
jgi:peptide-methionine (S)-S-oxide reductase